MRAQIARALAEARVAGIKLATYPGSVPETPGEAYAIQAEAARLTGWTVAGWKIGCTSEQAQRALDTDAPFPGPVYRERLYASGDLVPTDPGNTRLAEPEIAFRMAASLTPREQPYGVDEVLAAVATVMPAIEVVNPRLPGGFSDPLAWFIADGALNDALVLGDGVAPLARHAYAAIPVKVTVNGVAKTTGSGAMALGGPELALTWLANHLSARGLSLAAGHVVSTGVVTGLFSAEAGDVVVADFGLLGAVTARF
jgi:2-keto-4-pentenoate hydratase